jgi:hypothetical protein
MNDGSHTGIDALNGINIPTGTGAENGTGTGTGTDSNVPVPFWVSSTLMWDSNTLPVRD